MNVKVVLPGHGPDSAVTIKNCTPEVVHNADSGDDVLLLKRTATDGTVSEVGRFTSYSAYWAE